VAATTALTGAVYPSSRSRRISAAHLVSVASSSAATSVRYNPRRTLRPATAIRAASRALRGPGICQWAP